MRITEGDQLHLEPLRSIIKEELKRFAEHTLQGELLPDLRAQVRQDVFNELQNCKHGRPKSSEFLQEVDSSGNDEHLHDIAKSFGFAQSSESKFERPGYAFQQSSQDCDSTTSASACKVSPKTEMCLVRQLDQERAGVNSDQTNEEQLFTKRETPTNPFGSGINSRTQSRDSARGTAPNHSRPSTRGTPPPLPPIPNMLSDLDHTGQGLTKDEGLEPMWSSGDDNGCRFLNLQKGLKEKNVATIEHTSPKNDSECSDSQPESTEADTPPLCEVPGPEKTAQNSFKKCPSLLHRTHTARVPIKGGCGAQLDESRYRKMTIGKTDVGDDDGDPHGLRQVSENSKVSTRSSASSRSEVAMIEESLTVVRHRLRKAVLHPFFEYAIGILLGLNAIAIGFRAQYRAENPTARLPSFHGHIQSVFSILFTLEIALKIYVFRSEFLRTKGWQWNAFDLFVVTLQDAEFILDLCWQDDNSELEELSFTRLLRLGRVVRLLRMVRLIPELKSIVSLVAASMQSFIWTLVLLMLLLYGVAVHLTEVVADYLGSAVVEVAEAQSERLEGAWGTVLRSITSLYQSILGGIDWKDLMDDLQDISWSVPVMFMMYVAFGCLVMLNLVTGVFVEGAQRIVSEDRDAELIKQAHKVFAGVNEHLDQDVIDWSEFKSHLDDGSMVEYFRLLGMNRSDAKDLFRLLDLDSDGALSIKEFVHGCLSLRGNAKSLDLARVSYNFELVDRQVRSMDQKLTRLLDCIDC